MSYKILFVVTLTSNFMGSYLPFDPILTENSTGVAFQVSRAVSTQTQNLDISVSADHENIYGSTA